MQLVHDDGFHDLVERSLGEKFDADKLNEDIAAAKKELRRLERLQQQIENQLNTIDYDSKNALKVEESLNNRLYKVIEDITEVEERISNLTEQLESAQTMEDAKKSIYDFLEHFEEFFDLMDDADKKDFLKSFIDSIEVFPKRGPAKGKIIRIIHFNFPMYMKDGQMYKTVSFDEPDNGDDENGGNGGGGFPTSGGPRGSRRRSSHPR